MKHYSDIGITEKVRMAFFRGKAPELIYDSRESCPVEVGDEIALGGFDHAEDDTLLGKLYIRVLKLDTIRDGKCQVQYSVRDDRDRFLQRYAGTTTLRSRALDKEATYVDPEFIERLGTESRLKRAMNPIDPKKLSRGINVRLKAYFDSEADEAKWVALASAIEVLIRKAENG